jgi:hypothetical protein
MRSCAACLAESPRIYCSDACRIADEAYIGLRLVEARRCVCARYVEPERAAKGRKTCATCCERASKRTMRLYRVRVAAGLCTTCQEPLDANAVSKTTCRECRAVATVKGRELRQRKRAGVAA